MSESARDLRLTPTTDTYPSLAQKTVGNTKGVPDAVGWIQSVLDDASLDRLPAGHKRYNLAEQRLLAFCRSAQRHNVHRGSDDFILTVRMAASVMGLNPDRPADRMKAQRLLNKRFPSEGWLETVSHGDGRPGGPASIYRYLEPI